MTMGPWAHESGTTERGGTIARKVCSWGRLKGQRGGNMTRSKGRTLLIQMTISNEKVVENNATK